MGTTAAHPRVSRTMSMLWTPPGEEHTSQTGLTLAAIIDTATAIADERGDTAVPLRAIGKRLGCSAMALYTYVDGKDELLDLMYDRAHREFGTAAPVSVIEWTERLLELYLAHPWLLDIAPPARCSDPISSRPSSFSSAHSCPTASIAGTSWRSPRRRTRFPPRAHGRSSMRGARGRPARTTENRRGIPVWRHWPRPRPTSPRDSLLRAGSDTGRPAVVCPAWNRRHERTCAGPSSCWSPAPRIGKTPRTPADELSVSAHAFAQTREDLRGVLRNGLVAGLLRERRQAPPSRLQSLGSRRGELVAPARPRCACNPPAGTGRYSATPTRAGRRERAR